MNYKQTKTNEENVNKPIAPVIVQSTVIQNKSIDRLAGAIVFVVLIVALTIEQIAHTKYGQLDFRNIGDVFYGFAIVMSFMRAIFG